ncbi:hypothetical protein, partial [Hornefia butyriciproducens]|uniref:hypothetical protein n=1 Tax=Hornefia butyriciproducens TaxID=2652293 RepID=UPI0023F50F1B
PGIFATMSPTSISFVTFVVFIALSIFYTSCNTAVNFRFSISLLMKVLPSLFAKAPLFTSRRSASAGSARAPLFTF